MFHNLTSQLFLFLRKRGTTLFGCSDGSQLYGLGDPLGDALPGGAGQGLLGLRLNDPGVLGTRPRLAGGGRHAQHERGDKAQHPCRARGQAASSVDPMPLVQMDPMRPPTTRAEVVRTARGAFRGARAGRGGR